MERESIEKYICGLFGITKTDLTRRCRKQQLCEARHLLWKVLREHGYGVCQLADLYERRHGAVSHGVKQMNMAIQINRRIENKYNLVKSYIKNKKESNGTTY